MEFPNTITVFVEAKLGHNRLSPATKLICTNDRLTRLNGARLRYGHPGVTYYARGYDAGSEANDELFTSIVDPGGAMGPISVAGVGMTNRNATDGVVSRHPGIAGGADLDPALHGGDDPVLKV